MDVASLPCRPAPRRPLNTCEPQLGEPHASLATSRGFKLPWDQEPTSHRHQGRAAQGRRALPSFPPCSISAQEPRIHANFLCAYIPVETTDHYDCKWFPKLAGRPASLVHQGPRGCVGGTFAFRAHRLCGMQGLGPLDGELWRLACLKIFVSYNGTDTSYGKKPNDTSNK